MSDQLDRLRSKIDREYAAAWIPEHAGEEVCGTVVEIQPAVMTKKGKVPVVTLARIEGGDHVSVWLTHTALRRGFARLNIVVGETVLVRYLGRVQPEGGGEPYFNYRVAVDREEAKTVDWRAIAVEHKDDLDEIPEPNETKQS